MGRMQKTAFVGFQLSLFFPSIILFASPCDLFIIRSIALLIGFVFGGCFLMMWCVIYFANLFRKLKNKSRALAEIHAALAEQKVRPPFYSYADIRAATKNFSSETNLGQGAYGAVYRGKLSDGSLVAIKKLFKDRQGLAEFLNETVLITGIKHRNLVQLKGCCVKEDQRILVYELAEKGNLAEALWGETGRTANKIRHRTGAPLSWQQRLNICLGIARGLSYLHEELQPRIIHRDIKPANILIDESFNAKIADFGLARSFLDEQTRADYTRIAGTFGYLAPEYVSQGQLTEKADVFSFGIVLLEIVSGRKCIKKSLPSEKVSLVHWAQSLYKQGSVLDILDSSAQDSSNDDEVLRVVGIAFSCLHQDPAQRPAMSQVVSALQGNASAAFQHPPSFNVATSSVHENFQTLISGAASSVSGSSNRRDDFKDQMDRSGDLEISSLSGR